VKTLLDALLEEGLATDENAVYSAADMEDPDNCMRLTQGPFGHSTREKKTLVPGHFYFGLDLTPLTTLLGRVNYEWWWKRWGDRPEVIETQDDYDCLVRIGFTKWAPPWMRDPTMNSPRVFVDLTEPMEDADAEQLVADYKAWLNAMWGGRPVDPKAYAEARDSVIWALWEVERDDPLDFLAQLITAILDEMDVDPEDETSREFVERALFGDVGPELMMSRTSPLNLRQMYEDAGGDYRIEPDASFAEMSLAEGLSGAADKLEPAPVANFEYDEDVVDGVMRDPAIRNIFATAPGMAMNRSH
jgi:hypothetical protein